MASAFILPIHFFALLNLRTLNTSHMLFRLYFFVLICAALYHGLYRTYALCSDLGLGHIQGMAGKICSELFIIFAAAGVYALFF